MCVWCRRTPIFAAFWRDRKDAGCTKEGENEALGNTRACGDHTYSTKQRQRLKELQSPWQPTWRQGATLCRRTNADPGLPGVMHAPRAHLPLTAKQPVQGAVGVQGGLGPGGPPGLGQRAEHGHAACAAPQQEVTGTQQVGAPGQLCAAHAYQHAQGPLASHPVECLPCSLNVLPR